MKQLQTKIFYIEKPYFAEVMDKLDFHLFNRERLRKLEHYTDHILGDVRTHQALDVFDVYGRLKSIPKVLPKNCSHQWLHDYLVFLVEKEKINVRYEFLTIDSNENLEKARHWPGVITDIHTRIGSLVPGISKFYGINSPPPDGSGRYLDFNLMIFATGVP
jgi:hypothetical protein